MSLSKLSKLPPEVLSCVLNHQAIPLSRRLRLRLLCNRWADIIEDALKKVTSLVIRDGKGGYYRIRDPEDLIIKSTYLMPEFPRPLSRLFTSLTNLTLKFEWACSVSKIASLLAQLETSNLTAVKLEFSKDYYKEPIEPIAAELTALSALTSLTLVGSLLSVLLLPHLGPVLSRLEKFACQHYSGDLPSIITTSLSPRCTHLWLDSFVFQSFKSSFLVELSSNLTHLHLLDCGKTSRHYTLDSSLFSHLGPFSRLTQVKLYGLVYDAPLALPSKKESPLSSIKFLTLEVYFNDSPLDFQAFLQTINVWFPNLLKLTVIPERCLSPLIPGNYIKMPFAVEIVDDTSVDISTPDW